MQSSAIDVDRYLEEVPENRKEGLAKLRELCQDTLEDYEESMVYRMPSYAKDGTVEVAFASQKNYISLYILKQDVLNAHRDELKDLNLGKGCIRYSSPKKLNFDIIEKLLIGTRESDGEIC